MNAGFALFDTPIGICGLVWEGARVLGAQLPEGEAERARTRLARRFPGAREAEPPARMEPVIAAMRALLAGEAVDFGFVTLDMTGLSAFQRAVYAVTLAIPAGETLTYGEVAARVGEPGAARAVGVALGQNPFPIIVPCHRVLAAGGGSGGFSADGGVATKLRILTIEKARTGAAPGLFPALPFMARPA